MANRFPGEREGAEMIEKKSLEFPNTTLEFNTFFSFLVEMIKFKSKTQQFTARQVREC